MGRFTHQMASYRQQMLSVMRNEFRSIFTDAGVVLILVLALIIYATVYSMAYGAQVLRNVPIGVVDECRTPTSRSLAATFNAGPNTYVAYNPTNMEEAKELFFNRKIYGVVYIPSDYEEKLLGGSQANVAIYVDASYFLMYRQAFQELVTSIGSTGAMVEFQRLIAKGADIPQAKATTQPVIYQSHNLFNPYLGYGTFVMPAIIMVIIQQTLLIGIGMIGGTWREFGLYRKLCPPDRKRMSTLPIVLGKTTVYGLIYAVTTFYILGLHYRLFHYPMNGATGTVVVFMLAYLGIAISTLFRYRENSLLLLLWTSIPLLMLSGVSYPREGIPDWLFNFGQLFPSSHGVDGFIRIQSMGASLGEVLPEIRMLCILTLIYGRLRRAGLHRHSPGDRPRSQGYARQKPEQIMYVKYQMPLIAVSDVGRSKRFYCGLFDQRVVLDFGENVTFSGGFAIQEKFAWLTGLAEDSVRSRPNNMELYFETDDLDAFMQRLGEWPDPVELLHPPHKYGWQQCTVRFYDPDGHIVEVGEAMEVVIRRCLAEGHTAEETAALTQHPLEFVLRVRDEAGK